MGCLFGSQLYLSFSLSRGLIYLAVLLVTLPFGMIQGVDGDMGAGVDLSSDNNNLPSSRSHHVERRSAGLGRTVTLTNECTHREVQVIARRINALGIVKRRTNKQAQLLMTSQGDFGKVTIQSDLSKEYICFSSHGKLTTRTTKTGGDCIFREKAEHGKYKYQSVSNPKWFLGFRPNGRKLKGDLYTKKPRFGTCYFFSKPPIRGNPRDPYAPAVNFDLYTPHGRRDRTRTRRPRPTNNGSPSRRHPHRRFPGVSQNSNKDYAPKIDINKIKLRRLRHGHSRRRSKS